jgi:hypothetical protein
VVCCCWVFVVWVAWGGMLGLGVRVVWCSAVVMDLFEVAMVRGCLV